MPRHIGVYGHSVGTRRGKDKELIYQAAASIRFMTEEMKRIHRTYNSYGQLKFYKRIFWGVRFDNINFRDCSFIKCDLRNTTFKDCSIDRCIFTDSDMRDAEIEGGEGTGGVYKRIWGDRMIFRPNRANNVNFDGAILNSAQMPGLVAYMGASFKEIQADNINFTQAFIQRCSFLRSTLTNARFDEASLGLVSFNECNVRNMSIANASLNKVTWKDATNVKTVRG